MNIKEQKELLKTKKKKKYFITLDEFLASSGDIAVNCKTEKEAKMLFRAFKRSRNGMNINENYVDWFMFKEETCYRNINKTFLRSEPIILCRSLGIKILNFNEVDISEYLKENELEF